jgi:ADP-heptose:LPS heptosyltransferase
MSEQKRILLVHLVSLGDCLYATTIARQIKQDYPGCHLTWAISNLCSTVIENNPDVDLVWEVPCGKMSDGWGVAWEKIKAEAIRKKESGLFDLVFFTQLYPDNFSNYDGTIRSSLFRSYQNPITVPVSPVVVLTENEVKNVEHFARRNRLKEFRNVILFESSPGSGQSRINNDIALRISKKITDRFPDTVILLSSNQKIQTDHERIIDASELTFRENAELSKYCTLLVGCSSGITWLLTSTWAKKVPMIEILKKGAVLFEFASVRYDLAYWGEPTDHIIEITRSDDDYIARCIDMALSSGIEQTRKTFDERLVPRRFSLVLEIRELVFKKEYKKVIPTSRNYYQRNRDWAVFFVVPYALARAATRYPFWIITNKVKPGMSN